MILRATPNFRHLSAALLVLGALGCVDETFDEESQAHPNSIVGGPTCFTEDPGCGCVPGTEPVTCVHTEERGELVLCEAGAMYCVDGIWSDCDTVETWEVPRPKLISAPGACSPCNPDCFQTADEPSQTDITNPPSGVTSTNVVFTNGPPRGIQPIPIISTTGGTGTDTDMDGVPDVADACPTTPGMTRFFGCPTGTGSGGFFHVLPPGASAVDPLTFNVKLTEADVYILMDTTGSMGDEINNLKTSLTTGVFDPACPTLTGVIGAIRCTIPGTWFGVGRFDDYPVSPYGSSGWGDLPFTNLQDLTSSTTAAQNAVNMLFTRNGSDIPESSSQALYAVASGNSLTYNGTQYLPARTNCPAGRWGYPCFRPNVIPIVIMITDARMHNGPNGDNYAGTTMGVINAGSLGNTNSVTDIGDVSTSMRQFTGSTTNASNNYGTRCNSSSSDNSKDRLIRFTVSTTAQITMDLSGSSFDTYAYLYSGTNPTSGFLQCDDDGGSDVDSRIVRTLTPGTYTLRIDGYNNNSGNFVLTIGANVVVPGGVPYPDVVAAMNARNMRIIGVNSGPTSAYNDLAAVASDTNSLDGSGNPFIRTVSSNGSGLDGAIVNAVVSLANFSRMDVDVVVQNVNLLPGIPASALVQSITLGAPGCAGACTGTIPNGCSRCLPGTNLPFSVTFRNNVITPTAVDQVFNFDLIVRGNLGAIELQRVPVRIVVPANVPTTTYMPGTFSRTFSASDTCAIPPTRPNWGLFQWQVTTPGTTSVVFQFRTAETLAELNTVAPVTYSVPTGPAAPTPAQYINVGNLITAAGGRNFLPYLRVTAVLNPNAAGTQAPTLTSMGLQYSCVDSE
ncbi:MAG: VWA domain-containing protein [Myxococcales bacterium]|nr:VWA domain-containing protein [Myxococcales bacterium]